MIERYSFPRMSAIWQDEFKFKTMLDIELLALEAFASIGKVPRTVPRRIRAKARFSIAAIKKLEEKTNHDIVAFVTNVSQHIGRDAQYFHMGMTSSDLLDTTLGVQLKAASAILQEDIDRLLKVLAKKARAYKDMVCIGRTHGVHAEPTTFGLKLALWYDAMRRAQLRLAQATQAVCVGKISGAVGTYSNVDPKVETYICRALGLVPAPISTQIVQRDVYAQYMAALAVIGASLEQFATEVRHLQRTEVLEAEEPFGKGQKGSSAMPHKRNPVIAERICGMARVLRGNAAVAMENVALWHERDISHSSAERIVIPDSTILLDYMLNKFTALVEGMQVYPDHMLANLARTKGLLFSQKVLLVLMEKGLPRPVAYDYVQRCAMKTWRDGSDFKDNLRADKDVASRLGARELDAIFNLAPYLRHVNTVFRRLGLG